MVTSAVVVSAVVVALVVVVVVGRVLTVIDIPKYLNKSGGPVRKC